MSFPPRHPMMRGMMMPPFGVFPPMGSFFDYFFNIIHYFTKLKFNYFLDSFKLLILNTL